MNGFEQKKSFTGQAVIIAAGESSRFWPLNNDRHKSQMKLLGKSLLHWTLKGLADHGVESAAIVCAKESSIRQMIEEEGNGGIARVEYFAQEQPLGTGNALWQAREFVKEPFFLCWPNKINMHDIASKILDHAQNGIQAVLVGARTETPWDYGVVRFDGDRAVEIVENPSPGSEPSNVKAAGCYWLEPDFFEYYENLPSHHEADLIDAINAYLRSKKGALILLDNDVPALKYPWEAFELLHALFRSPRFQPSIAPSAIIGERVTIKGPAHIGERTVIKDGTVIEGPCFIGDDCEIGYHNVIRGGSSIERGVKTGAFCEIKHSIIQEGTHFHSGYVGDSIIGKNCRFGAGFVTANRRMDRASIQSVVKEKKIDTKLTFFGSVIGDGTHAGIHVGTMPGVFIGQQSVIGPGTNVFQNLPDHSLLYADPPARQKDMTQESSS